MSTHECPLLLADFLGLYLVPIDRFWHQRLIDLVLFTFYLLSARYFKIHENSSWPGEIISYRFKFRKKAYVLDNHKLYEEITSIFFAKRNCGNLSQFLIWQDKLSLIWRRISIITALNNDNKKKKKMFWNVERKLEAWNLVFHILTPRLSFSVYFERSSEGLKIFSPVFVYQLRCG